MTFWHSMPVSVSHFGDYILFIKIAVLTAVPGRARVAELGAGCALHIWGVSALEQLLEVKYKSAKLGENAQVPLPDLECGCLGGRRVLGQGLQLVVAVVGNCIPNEPGGNT